MPLLYYSQTKKDQNEKKHIIGKKGIAYRDRYLYVRDVWHDADAWTLALLCFDS